jgi:quercetin dioxygenase-like cupin family protein
MIFVARYRTDIEALPRSAAPSRITVMSDITHYFAAGLYAKQHTLELDEVAEKHVHSHDHLSILAAGCVIVDVDGQSDIYGAPACIVIKAGKKHKITGLMKSVWFCIHATDDTDPDHIDHVLTGD